MSPPQISWSWGFFWFFDCEESRHVAERIHELKEGGTKRYRVKKKCLPKKDIKRIRISRNSKKWIYFLLYVNFYIERTNIQIMILHISFCT